MAEVRKGRPPISPLTRTQIIDAAAVLFSQHGYDNGAISQVAETVGLSKAAIYYYFPTKQDLYDAITNEALAALIRAVESAIDPNAGADRKLELFMRAHARQFEADFWRCSTLLVGFGGIANINRNQEAARLRRRYESGLREILSEGIASGSFRSFPVASTGRAILSMLNWMVRWFKPGQGRSAEDFAAEYFELLLPGLLRERPAAALQSKRLGSQSTKPGKATSKTSTAKSAKRNGRTPR